MSLGLLAGAKFGGDLISAGASYFGNKAKLDRERAAINKQMEAERGAQGIGNEYYDMLAANYGPEAASYLADLASWRSESQKAPMVMQDFDTSKYTVDAYLDPSMDFQQQQARKAIEQSAASRGGMFAGSGATAKALQDRATQLAQTDYANAFQRMNVDRDFGYGKHKDLFTSAKTAEGERLARLQGLMEQSGIARENLFGAKGGKADLGMSTTRALGDLAAGKDRAAGEFYKSTWDTAGGLAKSGTDALGSYLSGGKSVLGSGVSGIGNLSQDQKMQLLQMLLGGK